VHFAAVHCTAAPGKVILLSNIFTKQDMCVLCKETRRRSSAGAVAKD